MRQHTLRYIFTILAIFATLGWNTQECKAQECDLQEVSSNHKRYHGDGIDDALRFVPITAAFALKAAGVESASSWKRLVVNSVNRERPDGTDNKSFPSGHTTFAFAGATILYKEYQHTSKWIGIAGYGVAALTAADRIRRNRHHWEDVAAGAAIGVGGTMLGYYLGDLITGEESKYSVGFSANTISLCIHL